MSRFTRGEPIEPSNEDDYVPAYTRSARPLYVWYNAGMNWRYLQGVEEKIFYDVAVRLTSLPELALDMFRYVNIRQVRILKDICTVIEEQVRAQGPMLNFDEVLELVKDYCDLDMPWAERQ